MKKNIRPTLLDAVYSCRLWGKGYWHAAQAVPLHRLVNASKFERAQVAAVSLKEQREILKKARAYIAKGQPDAAQLMLACYRAERAAYNNLFTFGSK